MLQPLTYRSLCYYIGFRMVMLDVMHSPVLDWAAPEQRNYLANVVKSA